MFTANEVNNYSEILNYDIAKHKEPSIAQSIMGMHSVISGCFYNAEADIGLNHLETLVRPKLSDVFIQLVELGGRRGWVFDRRKVYMMSQAHQRRDLTDQLFLLTATICDLGLHVDGSVGPDRTNKAIPRS